MGIVRHEDLVAGVATHPDTLARPPLTGSARRLIRMSLPERLCLRKEMTPRQGAGGEALPEKEIRITTSLMRLS